MEEKPVYISKCSIRSLWQEYRIYPDHLEFDTIPGKMVINFDQIEKTTVSESEIKGLFHGDLHLKDFRPALKLDWANFTGHIVLDKSSGHIHRILFTPDDPRAFKTALDDAIRKYRDKKGN